MEDNLKATPPEKNLPKIIETHSTNEDIRESIGQLLDAADDIKAAISSLVKSLEV